MIIIWRKNNNSNVDEESNRIWYYSQTHRCINVCVCDHDDVYSYEKLDNDNDEQFHDNNNDNY